LADITNFTNQYITYVNKIKELMPNKPIILIEPFTMDVLPGAVKQVAATTGCYYLKISQIVPTYDGVHPTSAGHDIVSTELVNFIKNNGIVY
jgi:lysophospholipase L1-like esterase